MNRTPCKNKPKRAFILAAGKGTRLRPYTDNCPKPLVNVGGLPILDHSLNKLEKEGVTDVTINVSYLGDMIEKHFEGRQTSTLTFSKETEPLETGGGVKKALHTMNGEAFYLINGDALWTDGPKTSALHRLAETWDPETMDILILLQPLNAMTLTHGSGDYDLNGKGEAVRSLDKSGAYMFGGIRITKSDIFDGIKEENFSFLKLMDEAQEKGRLHGIVHDGEWHHISTPEDLDRVNDAMTRTSEKAGSA